MRRLAALALGLLALALAGCGDKQAIVTEADTEGVSVDVGKLVYQVQLSRYLNPADVEDKDYLMGLPAGTPGPKADETWFGVWMRVKNFTDQTQRPASQYTISDTEGAEYHPIPQSRSVNPFIYEANPMPAHTVLPVPESAAANGPIQGSLILFKLKTGSLQNRPLVLTIAQQGQDSAEVDIDL